MTQTVRVGLIGTSWWMDMAHLPTMRADPRVAMVAICGRNAERAQEIADKYAIRAVFTDYHDMIARADLDAIVIATPDDLHCEMTMVALDAGLHVLCEKPLALNATDARAMYDKAEAQGVCHMTYFTWRWMPHYRYMRELIEQGALGRLYHAQFSFLMGGGRDPAYAWRFDRARANGVLGDLGSHMFDLARYLVGDIARVSAHLACHVQREGVDGRPVEPANDSAMALVEFVDGAQGTVQVSVVARVADPYFEQQVVLHGEAGSMKADLTIRGGPQLQIAKGDEPWQLMTIPDYYWEGVDTSQPFFDQLIMLFSQQQIGCRLFVDGILEKRSVVPGFYEGWKAQQVIDAAIASSEQRCWVEV
jgi:predicted dehydrogenase